MGSRGWWLLCLGACGGGPGDGDKAGSDTDAGSAPTCELSSPAEAQTSQRGTEVQVQGEVGSDGGAEDLLAVWRSSLDGQLSGGTQAGEVVELRTSNLSVGEHTITLEVTDADGLSCTASVDLRVGAAPVLALKSPAQDAVVGEGSPVELAVSVLDPDGDLADLEVVFRSDVDGELGVVAPGENGIASVSVSTLSRGAHVWTAEATDADGFTSALSARAVVDGVPTGLAVSIDPPAPTTGQALTLVVDSPAVDPEGKEIQQKITWQRDGSTFLLGGSVPEGVTYEGEVWTAVVVASDGERSAPPVSVAVTIANGRPIVSEVTLSPASPSAGETLAAGASVVDPEGDAFSLSYTFREVGGGVLQQGPSDEYSDGERGQIIEVEVVASDAGGAGSAVVSASVEVVNAAPSALGAAVTPASPSSSDALTCAVEGYSDPEGDDDQTKYSWSTNDGPFLPHGATVPAGTFKGGQSVVCQAIPYDGVSEGTPVQSAAVPIRFSPPTVSGGTLSKASPNKSDTVCVVDLVATDVDGENVSLAFAWQVGGRSIGNLACVSLSSAVRGETLVVSVTPSDSHGTGEPVEISAVVGNAPPVVSQLEILPVDAKTGDPITLGLSISDPDGDVLATSVAFVVDQVEGEVGTSLELGRALVRGQKVYADVNVFDGHGGALLVSAPEVTIGNAPPEPATISLSPTPVYEDDEIHCVIDVASTDPEGDLITYEVSWTVDGEPYEGGGLSSTDLDDDTIAPNVVVLDERWACTVEADDGEDTASSTVAVTVSLLP